jgi:hypothetical protein
MTKEELNFLHALKQLCIEHKIYIESSNANGCYLGELKEGSNLAVGIFSNQFCMSDKNGEDLNRPEMLV